MSASSPSGLIGRARSYSSIQALLFGGIGGFILAFWEQAIRTVLTFADFFLTPVATLTNELAAVIGSFVGGGASIIGAGAETTIQSLLPGGTWALGPFTFGGAVIAAGIGIAAMAFVLQLSPTSNLIPFSFTDSLVPGAGVDESDESLPEEE